MAGYCFYVESLQSWIVTKPTVMYGRILFLCRVLTELDCYQANSDVWQGIVSMVESLQSLQSDCYQANSDVWQGIVSM